jgi:hypothetical protein
MPILNSRSVKVQLLDAVILNGEKELLSAKVSGLGAYFYFGEGGRNELAG